MATSLPLNRIPGYVDWVKQPVGSRLQVRWETNDKKSPDYGHLAQPTATADFVVNAKVLEAYRDLNSFKLWSGQPLVLFGLRGAILSKPSTDFASELVVKEAYPDHENFKCVIGIWDTRNGMVRGFRASTVPNVEYMARQVFKYRCFADQNASCYAPGEPMTLDNEANLRPPGLYRYVVGTHSGGSSTVPNAFRDLSESYVRRSYDDLCFTVDDWSKRTEYVGDNIHCAYFDTAPYGGLMYFSSAGCQTIPGTFVGGEHYRDWQAFLSAVRWPSDGTQFDYLLMCGREARVLSQSRGSPQYRRLRFGSSGPTVQNLRRALGLVDGFTFDARVAKALVEWQASKGQMQYGLLDQAQAQIHGIVL